MARALRAAPGSIVREGEALAIVVGDAREQVAVLVRHPVRAEQRINYVSQVAARVVCIIEYSSFRRGLMRNAAKTVVDKGNDLSAPILDGNDLAARIIGIALHAAVGIDHAGEVALRIVVELGRMAARISERSEPSIRGVRHSDHVPSRIKPPDDIAFGVPRQCGGCPVRTLY